MSILINNLKEKFTTLPNEAITDTRICPGAFRVLSYLFSKPSSWKVNNSDIQKQLNISTGETMAKYWKELIKTGWLSRTKKKSKTGKFNGGFDYELNISPKYGLSVNRENTKIGKTTTHSNTDSNSNTDYLYKPELENSVIGEKITYAEIVTYLNEKANTSYRDSTKKTKEKIKARWNEGFRLDDFKKVIDDRVKRWINDPHQKQYLRPETLFGNKFEGYLNAYTAPTELNNITHLMDCELSEEEALYYLEYQQYIKDKMPQVFDSVQILKASDYFSVRPGGSRWESLRVEFTQGEIKDRFSKAHVEAAEKIKRGYECPNIIELLNQRLKIQKYA